MSRYLYWMWHLQGTWWKFLVATLNSNTKIKTFQDSQGRAALFASPFLQNLKCKFPQYFQILIGISPKLRWGFGFFIAWPLRICVCTTFRILSLVILITWGPESGLAKFFFCRICSSMVHFTIRQNQWTYVAHQQCKRLPTNPLNYTWRYDPWSVMDWWQIRAKLRLAEISQCAIAKYYDFRI